MNYSYNAVKFTDRRSYNKNKLKKNVKAYYDQPGIIVFKDRQPVTMDKTKVSHSYRMGEIKHGVPTDKAILRVISMDDALAYCAKEKIKIQEQYDSTGILIVSLPLYIEFNEFHTKAIESGAFYSVQQNHIIKVEQHAIDYDYNEIWQLPALRCQEAWDLIDAAPPALDNVVCVMDWGCDTTHPNLIGKMVNNINNVIGGTDVMPLVGSDNHGTPCSGQICASNNGINAMGVSPYYTKVSFVYIFANGYPQDESSFVIGVQHAIDQPDCIAVSCSFGGGGYRQSWQDIITDALLYGRGGNKSTGTLGLGTLIIASAGNGPCNGGCDAPINRNMLPASYDGVMSITAIKDPSTTSPPGQYLKTNWADWGNKLFCAAPGNRTPGADRVGQPGYTTYDTTLFGGTSSACPITAGVAALVHASNPTLSANGIKEAIRLTCNKVGPYNYDAVEPGKSFETGWGMVDAYAAVLYATSGQIDPGPGVTPNLRVSVSGNSITNQGDVYNLSYSLTTNIALPVAETINVTIFYSQDISYDPGDTIITSFTVTIPQNGYSYLGQEAITIPNTISGNYYIGVNASTIGGETYPLDNTAFQGVLIIAPPAPPTGLNLAVEIVSLFIDPTTALPVVEYRFENIGAETVYNFRYRKGFVGRDNFEYEKNQVIKSEEYLTIQTLWKDVPPQSEWPDILYRIEILNVNGGIPDDVGGDNISEATIDPGPPSPTP
jgi:hypothetical protein